MASNSPSGTGMTVFVRVCPQIDPSAPLSKRAAAVLDKKGSFASSFSLKNSFISSKNRNSSLLPGHNSDKCIVTPDEKTIRVLKSGAAAREGDKEYNFDKVFPEESSQEELCINVHDHVLEVVSGFNVTIICHGASKSGKSFTMTGTKEARGIIPHAIKSVFAHIDKIRSQEPDLYFYAEVGYVELYNNIFRDLLFNSGGSASLGGRDDGDDDSVVIINDVGELDSMFDGSASGRKSLRNSTGSVVGGAWSSADEGKIQVHESKNLGVFLAGSPTLRVAVSSAQDVFQLYSSGQKVRSSRVTETGHVSSRSHAILILYLESRAFTGESSSPSFASSASPASSPDAKILQAHQQAHPGTSGLRMSKLTFVDMAGADRLEISGAVGDTLVESQNINLSLNAFGDVLFALSKNAKAKQGSSGKGMQHVPYLNSKLTQLLKESLGGNAKTVMITTIHATSDYSKVTETSLQYASWARAVRGKVVRNDLNMSDKWIAETDPEILRLKKLLEERSKDFARLRVAQLNRPPLAPPSSNTSSGHALPLPPSMQSSPGSSPAGSPLKVLQKRLSESSQSAAPESKSNGFDSSSLKNRISDLELTNQELKEDVARKSRQSADLSMSLKKSLELIQQQNKALTDQLNDVANDKDAQIAVLNERLAGLERELAMQNATNQGDADEALIAANSELERAKKSAWDRYLTITQQQEQITTLEKALDLEKASKNKNASESDQKVLAQLAEAQAAVEEQRQALDQERANLHAALKAAEDHVYEQEVHLQEQHASQAYQINSWKDKCEVLQAELAAKDAELTKSRLQAKDAAEKLSKESRLLTAESAKSSDLQASLDMHIALVSSLKLKMSTLQGHMAEETGKRVEKETKMKELEAELSTLRAERDRLQSEHDAHSDDLTGMLQDSSVELQNLVNLVSAKDKDIKNLEARLAAATDALAAEKQSAHEKIQAVEAQLRDQVESHHQLSAKYLQRNSEAEALDSSLRTTRTLQEEQITELTIIKKKLVSTEEVLVKERSTTSELNQALQKAHKLHEASVNQFTDELLDLNVKLQTSNNLAQELNRTIHDYERQIETLRARLDDTIAISEADAAAAQDQLVTLEAQLAEKQAALARESERSRELEAQRKALKDEVASRESEKKQLVRQIKDLEEKLALEVQKRKSEVEAAHELRKEALGASKSDLEQYIIISEQKIVDLERELAASEQKNDETSTALNDKIQEGLLALRQLEEETAQQLADRDAEIQQLEQKLNISNAERVAQEAAAQNAAKASQMEIDNLRAQIVKLQERALDLESENQVLRSTVEDKEAELQELVQKAELDAGDLTAALETQTALVASLRLKLDILQGSRDEEAAARKDRERRVASLEAQNSEIELAAARTQKKLEHQLEELASRLAERSAKIQELEPLAPERDAKIEQLEISLRRAESDLRDKAEHLQDLEAKLKDLQLAHDKLSALCREKTAELESTLELGQSQRRTMDAQAKEISLQKSAVSALEARIAEEVDERAAEVSSLEAQVAALKDALADAADAIKRANADREDAVADLDDRVQEYSINIDELQNALNIKEATIAMLKDKLAAQEQRAVSESNARIATITAAEHVETDLKEKLADLAARLKEAVETHTADAKQFKLQLGDKQRVIEDVSASLANCEAALKSCESKLSAQVQRSVEEAKSRKAETSALNARVVALEADKVALTQALANARKQLDETSADLKEQLGAAKAKAEEHSRALAVAENQLALQVDKLGFQEQRTVSEINARRAEAAAHDEQTEELQGQIAELEERLSAAVDAHRSDVQSLGDKIHDAKRIAEELAQKLLSAEGKLAAGQAALMEQEQFTKAERDRREVAVAALEKQVGDLDQLCASLQDEISELEKNLARSETVRASDSQELQTLLEAEKARVVALNNDLTAAQEALRETQAQLVAQAQLSEKELLDHQATNAALEEQVASLEGRVSELEESLHKTRRMHDMSVADLVDENLAAEARCEELSDEITDLNSELDDMRNRNASLQAELEGTVSREDHDDAIDALRTELEALEELRASQEAAALAALRTVQAELAELAAVEVQLKAEIEEINEDRKKALDSFKARIEELEAELKERLAECEQLSELVQDKDVDIQVLNDKLNEAEYVAKIEAEGFRSMLESAENQRKTLVDAREVLQHRHRQAVEDLNEARTEASELRGDLARSISEMERMAARLAEKEAHLVAEVNARAADAASFEERLDGMRSANDSLEESLRLARNEIDKLEEVLHAKDAEHARAAKNFANQLAARDASIEQLEAELSGAETLTNELQAQIAKLHAEVGALNVGNNRLKADVDEQTAAAESARAYCAVLEKKLADSINARTAEKEAYHIELELLDSARAIATTELAAAQSKAASLSADLCAAVDALNAEREHLSQVVREKDTQIAELSVLVKQKDAAVEELSVLADQLEAESAARLVLANDRLADIKAMDARIHEVDAKLAAKVEEASLLSQLLLAAEIAAADLREALAEAQTNAVELERKFHDASAFNSQLVLENKKLLEDLAASQQRTDEVQVLLEEEIALAETLKMKLATQGEVFVAEKAALLAEIAGLKNMILELQDEKADLAQSLRQSELMTNSLEKDAKQLQAQNKSLHLEIQEGHGKLKRLLDDLSASEQSVADLTSKLSDSEAAKQAVAVIVQDRLKELNALQGKCDDLKAMLADLHGVIHDKDTELAAAEKLKADLMSAIKENEAEIADNVNEINRLEEELAEVSEESDRRAAETMASQERIDELQALFEQEIALVETLKVKIASQEKLFSAEHLANQKVVDGLKQLLSEYQEEKAELSEALAASTKTAAAVEKELKDLQALHTAQVAELASKLNNAAAKLVQTEEDLESNREEVRGLKDKLAELAAANQAISVQSQDRLSELNVSRDRLSDAVQQLVDLRAEAIALEEQAAEEKRKTEAARSALQRSETDLAELKRRLSEAEAAKEALTMQVQKRVTETTSALERADDLQALFEEQVALVESLKVKLATQEDLHTAERDDRAAEIAALQSRVVELQQAMLEAQDTIVNLAQLRRENEVSIETLNKQIHDEAHKYNAQKEQLDAKSKDVESLRNKLHDANAAHSIRESVADAAIAELQAAQVSLDGTIAELLNKQNLLTNELAEKSAVVSRLAENNASLAEQVQNLEEQLRSRVEVAEKSVIDLNTDLDLQIAMVASLKTKLKALQEQLEESAHSLVHETASLEQCQAELQAAQAALRHSQFASDAKLASAQEEEASLQRVNALLVSQLQEKEQQAASSEAKVLALNEQLSARKAELKRLEAELFGASGASRQSLREVEEKLREAEAKLVALTADQVAQTNYISEVDAQRKALKAEVSGKSAEVLRLESMLEKLQEECRDQAAHLAKLRVQFAAAQVRLEEEGHRRIRQLAAHEQRVSELEVAKVAADHVQQRYEAKIAALTNELNATSGKRQERMSL